MAEKNKENQVEELEALKLENTDLKKQLEKVTKENKTLIADEVKLREDKRQLDEDLTAKEEVIKELSEALAAKDEEVKAAGKHPVFTVSGKDYELVVPKSKGRYQGKVVEITAESLKEDKKLLAHCVEAGYGVLQERKKGGK
jgi:L-lactate utilization protein LutB